jgi:hypothetical protein
MKVEKGKIRTNIWDVLRHMAILSTGRQGKSSPEGKRRGEEPLLRRAGSRRTLANDFT